MGDLSNFRFDCDRVFANRLARFGFAPAGEQWVEDWYVSRIYRADSRYVEIVVSNLWFRDERPHCGVYLGEGDTEWPETDWNKIALWQLGVGVNESVVGNLDRYPLRSLDELPKVLRTIRVDLLAKCPDFLSGSLDRFRESRSRINRQREPYKVYSPDASGRYTMRYDKKSAALKRRFSK
jgi:hypothetical protein